MYVIAKKKSEEISLSFNNSIPNFTNLLSLTSQAQTRS